MSALAQQSKPTTPIVVVAGPTGVGKSLLAIELAKKFNGEVLNADSMQLYDGLDIVTNKVTPEELALAPHHLIGCLSPLTTDSTVCAYRQLAQPLLDQLLNDKNCLPIICGGTCYYIESLLWDILLDDKSGKSVLVEDEEVDLSSNQDYADDDADPTLLHDRLRSLDPEAADRLHPNNRRQIKRALQVNLRCSPGAYSAMLREQHRLGDSFSGPLRYPPTRLAILWLGCRRDLLDQRIDSRVDKMIDRGLLNELELFHERYNATRGDADKDYTRGIFQSIGFKEFHEYLIMSPEQRSTPEGQSALNSGIELMKQRTKRYAVQQQKWLRNRFLGHPDDNYAPVYLLNADSVEESDWNASVRQPAFDIVDALIKSQSLNTDEARVAKEFLLKHSTRLATRPRCLESDQLDRQHESHIGNSMPLKCDYCNLSFNQPSQYREHMASRRHAKRMAGVRRLAARIAAGKPDPSAVLVIDRNTDYQSNEESSELATN